jgi:methyl coenzyme M reductase system subunit A2
VNNLFKEFIRGEPAYIDISFTIKVGEPFGILGKSGSGKTALMQALRGTPEYRPTRGTVTYRLAYCEKCHYVDYPTEVGNECSKCGRSEYKLRVINFWEEQEKNSLIFRNLYNRISIMLQRTFALYGEATVDENIKRNLEKAGVPAHRIGGQAALLISRVKMEHRAYHLARDLSGGEKQRVVFAICLAKKPLLFLADEPTGTLDPVTAERIHKTINREVRKNNLTIVVTSHWPEAVDQLTEKAILLENGKIAMFGDSHEVATKFLSQVEEVVMEKREFDQKIIKVEDLIKYYYSFDRGLIKAVDGVSLDIYEGEIFGIVGVSGSGKTSLAHMICGLKPCTNGSIKIRKDEEWVDMSIPGPRNRGKITRDIGILHQEYSIYPHRTVLQNMTGTIRESIPEELKTKKAYDALKAVNFTDAEIDNILYKFPDQISEGERHRVAIARILIQEPIIVFFDEATGTADPLTRMEIVRSIKKSREMLNQTYVIISHDIDFINTACDRAALMRDGHIITIGEPKEVVETLRTYQEQVMK